MFAIKPNLSVSLVKEIKQTDKCTKLFELIKEFHMQAPILRAINCNIEFYVHKNALAFETSVAFANLPKERCIFLLFSPIVS